MPVGVFTWLMTAAEIEELALEHALQREEASAREEVRKKNPPRRTRGGMPAANPHLRADGTPRKKAPGF